MAVRLFIISSFFLMVYQLIYLKPEYSGFFIGALVVGMVLLAISMAIKGSNKAGIPSYCRKYSKLLWGMMVLMFSMTLIHNWFGVGDYSLSYIIQDTMSMITYGCGIVFLGNRDSNEELVVKYLKIIGAIAVVAGIIALSFADLSQLSNRDANVWKPQYIWWFLLYPWSHLLLYKSIVKNNSMYWKIISCTVTFLYIVLGLLFLKRIVLLELFIIVIIISAAKMQKIFILNVLKNMLIFIGVVAVGFAIAEYGFSFDVSPLIDSTWSRVADQSIQNFDRFDEFINLFKQYPYSVIITGAGLGAYQHGPGGINLHIGWLNFIFKGGILFVALELWVFTKAITIFLNSSDNWQKYVSACVIFGYTTIIISSSWTPTPPLVLFSVMKFAMLSSYSDGNQHHFSKVIIEEKIGS